MAVAQATTRPRPGGGRLFIILGLVLFIAAFGLVFLIGNAGRGGTGGPTVKYVVAARDIQIREQLTSADLTLADFSQDPTAGKGFTKIEDVAKSGFIAEVNIAKGQPVSTNLLAKSGDIVSGAQPAFLPIPQGFVAITIPTNEMVGVAGYVQAGDYINIIATLNPSQFASNPGQKSIPVVKTVWTNLHVLRLGPSSGTVQSAGGGANQQQGQAGGVSSSLTVVVTQCDAEYLNWLLQNSQLKYTLGSYKDYQPQDTKPDPTCASASAAKGVTFAQVDTRWGFSHT